MLGLIIFLVLAYLISNFIHFSALKDAYKNKGMIGALNISLAIMIHQIASLFVK